MNTSDEKACKAPDGRILIEICLGTTCHLMGSSDLQDLEEQLPERLRGHVRVKAVSCLGYCGDRQYGKAPYVRVHGELLAAATMDTVIERLDTLCPHGR